MKYSNNDSSNNSSNRINSNNNRNNNLVKNNLVNKTIHILKLPNKGDNGIGLIKFKKRPKKRMLHYNHDVRITLKSTRWNCHFNMRNYKNKEQKHGLDYLSKSPSAIFNDSYVGEIERHRHLKQGIVDHSGINTAQILITRQSTFKSLKL